MKYQLLDLSGVGDNMYIGKREDGTVYGLWLQPQPNDEFHTGIEKVTDDHPDVLAFKNRPRPVYIDPRDTKIAELEARLETLERAR